MKNVMKQLRITTLILTGAIMYACGSGSNEQSQASSSSQKAEAPKVATSIKEGKGVGEVKNVVLTDPLEEGMFKKGKAIYEMKCSACHKVDAKRVVGPGFEGITNKRRPEWIMNMITNVDVMLDEDPTAQKLLEECLTRMPNQNVSIGDARDLLEFMRHNDEARLGTRDEAAK
jgi:cytochrome c5